MNNRPLTETLQYSPYVLLYFVPDPEPESVLSTVSTAKKKYIFKSPDMYIPLPDSNGSHFRVLPKSSGSKKKNLGYRVSFFFLKK